MPLPHKFGTLSPVIYFAHPDGHLTIAPYTDAPTPEGAIRCEAGSLVEIDRLQAKLNSQCKAEFEEEMAADDAATAVGRARVRDKLYQMLTSSATSEAEKDFIREYLKLREEKREKHHQKYAQYVTFLHAREFDLHGRDPNTEKAPS
jgi:hypothetical protein